MPEVGLILLAAGESRRMGQPKQLLDVGGVAMLRRAAMDALASQCRPVAIVCGAAEDAVRAVVDDLPVQLVRNPNWKEGIGASIRAGVRALVELDVDAVVVALADQPLLSAATFDRLVTTYRAGRLPVAASEYAGSLGAPALFDRSLFARLLDLPPGQGCKQLITTLAPELVARCPCAEAATDIDTPDDYSRLRSGPMRSSNPNDAIP